MNTPESSASGNVHGMPLAHLLGHGHPLLAGIARPGPAVRAENVVVVGARDLDPPEREHPIAPSRCARTRARSESARVQQPQRRGAAR